MLLEMRPGGIIPFRGREAPCSPRRRLHHALKCRASPERHGRLEPCRGGRKPRRWSATGLRLWDGAPRTIMLLYALQPILGQDIKQLFSDPQIFRKLDDDSDFLNSLKKALRLYGSLSRGFAESVGHNSNAASKWRPVEVSSSSMKMLPQFTAEQRKRYQKLCSKDLPTKVVGTHGKSIG